MNKIPDPNECIALLRKSGCSEKVIAHCKAVRDIAVKIAQRAHADKKLVEAGALLHDIGRAKTHGIDHGIVGAAMAKELGLPETLILIIERHLGAGIPKEVALQVGLPSKDYLPETLEEKIVAHADNLIDDGTQQPIQNEIDRALKENNFKYAHRLRQLHQELSSICGQDLDEL